MLLDFLRLSLSNLWRHLGRSLLTALGIIIGVGAVVCMAGYGEGSKRAEIASIQALGARNILLVSVKPPLSASPPQSSGTDSGDAITLPRINAYGIKDLDIERIKAPDTGPVENAVPLQRVGNFVYCDGMQFPQAEVYGTLPDLLQVAPIRLECGRFLSNEDAFTLKNVVVIGSLLARQMFPTQDPLGCQLEINGQPFVVIGVLDQSSRVAGEPVNFSLYLPLETARSRFDPIRRQLNERGGDNVEVSSLVVRVPENTDVVSVANRIRRVINLTHETLQDVEIRVPMELIAQKEHARMIFTVLMVLIASLSLLVGGIGIMNIMLASVVERTREIGIRRALGATRRQIGAQFLVETTALSCVGGILGILLGLGGCGIISWLSHHVTWLNPAIPELLPIGISFTVSAGVGIVFGIYPAWRAAAQDPITALRHD